MLEPDGSRAPRSEEHDRWLAMQSAYADYRNASQALEKENSWADDSSGGEPELSVSLEAKQRAAFERYLEARMAYLEFRFDQCDPRFNSRSELSVARTRPVGAAAFFREPFWRSLAAWKFSLPVILAVMLCAMAVSIVGLERQLRDLENGRQEFGATLERTSDMLRLLGRRLESGEIAQYSAVREVKQVSPAPASGKPAAAAQPGWHKPGEARRKPQAALHVTPKKTSGSAMAFDGTQSQSLDMRTYRFALPLSSQFKQVGPVKLSIRSMDLRRNAVSLSLVSDVVKLEAQGLRLNQPLWIHVGNGLRPMELVVERISANRLEGRLMAPESRPDLSASLKPGLSAIR